MLLNVCDCHHYLSFMIFVQFRSHWCTHAYIWNLASWNFGLDFGQQQEVTKNAENTGFLLPCFYCTNTCLMNSCIWVWTILYVITKNLKIIFSLFHDCFKLVISAIKITCFNAISISEFSMKTYILANFLFFSITWFIWFSITILQFLHPSISLRKLAYCCSVC